MPQKSEDRDYRKEYDNYHSKPKQRKNRSKRNKARRKMEKKGKVRKGDGKEVDHRIPLSKGGSNHASNLRVMSRSANRKKYTGGNKKRPSQRKSRDRTRSMSGTASRARMISGKAKGPKSVKSKIDV